MATFPQVSLIYDRYKKASSEKRSAVEVRVAFQGKQKYLSTGIKLYPRQWRNGMVVNSPDAQQLNIQLNKVIIDIRQILMKMSEKGCIDIFAIPMELHKHGKGKKDFYDYIRERTDIKKYGKSDDTQARYERFIRLFKKWGGIRNFEDVTSINIIAYDKYLAAQGMKDYSKWMNYHRFLNSFIIDAVDEGYLERNPYKYVNIRKGEDGDGLHRYLTPEEFHRLKRTRMPTDSLEHVRDVFVFQTYTCLSYTDLRNFDVDKLCTIKGMRVYTGKRGKTGKQFTIPLLPPALDILEKYKGRLPIISNVKYNEYLKVVAQAAGIDKPVSTHWARHTGATLLLNDGVDMKIISRICGHSSTKITEQVYAKLLDETVVDAVKKLKNKGWN